ncbi:sensor histidine kinase [Paenibacillus harenae]|uniref:sensor histidine kinase n=1 Tax=Paenibacillus harenae TaxID=306543 RepID=UPI002791B215|nr:HAMP domain-containing sensor histidine kinase [Paenibacillus harenae]MDQ0059759.1 signal transduction histidine kinase [Paenibacillus harenae]
MSIKVKLYMSYLAMVIVPFILMIGFMMFVFYAGGMQDIRQYFEVEKAEKMSQMLIYGELSYVIENDADKLNSESYLNDLQSRLSEQWAGLLITKEGKLVSIPPFLQVMSPEQDWQKLIDNPPEKATLGLFRFETDAFSFHYPDGSEGVMLLLRRYDVVPLFWRPAGTAIGLAFVALTGLLLTYFVSRSIIRPIEQLKTAALQIKDGDLSQQLVTTGRGEIGQLSAAFEAMRIRLKYSIDQSLQYEENRKMLLSHISHDLKTPISAIKGYVEGIMDGIANTDEKRERYMQTIYRKAEDMDQLIDELFLFSKLDLQTVAFDFKTLDISRYLEHFLEEQRFDLEKSGVTLHYEAAAELPIMIAADPDKLSRVLTNILNNCVKYMGQQADGGEKRIDVSMRAEDRHVLIELEDTGPGIEEEDLPHIFDRFYRAEQSRNSETGGSGLGLAIVKQIIEGHGGVVWAENAIHGGARFCLKLPLATTPKAVTEHEEHTHH